MEVVFGLLLMLLGVSHGVETYCDGRQNGTQCYGALGGTVVIQLTNSISTRFKFFKNNRTLFSWRRDKIESNDGKNKFIFTLTNGTLRINSLSQNDTDIYELITYNSDGIRLEVWTLHLSIQAPVSSVLLVSECLSQGERRVSCSSLEGDRQQYNWTLDGHTLKDTELLAGNHETDNITLKQHVSGLLVCSVRNHVSHVSMEERISTCGFIFINCTISNETHISEWVFAANNTLCIEPTTTPPTVADTTVGKKTTITVSVKPSNNITSSGQNGSSFNIEDPWFIIMAGVLAALVTLLVVGGAVIYVQKKKKNNTPKGTKEEADEQELTYADVMGVQRRQVQQMAEAEVEYGQIQFSHQPRRIVEPTGDECVYAKVR